MNLNKSKIGPIFSMISGILLLIVALVHMGTGDALPPAFIEGITIAGLGLAIIAFSSSQLN